MSVQCVLAATVHTQAGVAELVRIDTKVMPWQALQHQHLGRSCTIFRDGIHLNAKNLIQKALDPVQMELLLFLNWCRECYAAYIVFLSCLSA